MITTNTSKIIYQSVNFTGGSPIKGLQRAFHVHNGADKHALPAPVPISGNSPPAPVPAGQRAAPAGPNPVHHRDSEQLLRAEEEVRVSQRRVESQLGHEQGLLQVYLFFENSLNGFI